ncbi:hypothetical protein [Caldisalinibacter kiritimatiensis]|uniref:Uncharacterized protein n=1 Tax=Caldisalinibacter kiritimatiensis TaxID=1304284 RepID=R1CS26_9FIRM|nr:hypothetical protein [Caldisalinibacter kiritimatiensis]EOD01456.1 hypothetical protein L21TH_0503 [Caldisalinibacter kiritimatiensis]
MNINKIKELGELEKELNELGKTFKKLVYQKKKDYLNESERDFEKFFKDKGFDVRKLGNSTIEASHGNTRVKLDITRCKYRLCRSILNI